MLMPGPQTIRRKQFETNYVPVGSYEFQPNAIAQPLSQFTLSLETHVADIVHLASTPCHVTASFDFGSMLSASSSQNKEAITTAYCIHIQTQFRIIITAFVLKP